MNRREFVVLSSATALTACAGGTTEVTVAIQVVQDVAQIASGLTGSLSSLSGSPLFNTISGYVTSIAKLASLVTTTTPVSSAQGTVGQIETLINDILSVAADVPLPPPFGPAIQAAAILLPVVESALNMLLSKPHVMTARLQARQMTSDQARAILAAAAHGR